MQITGRRFHLAGSASAQTPDDLLRYAHHLVEKLVKSLADHGATFLLSVGKEPTARSDDPSSPAVIFDWTALATLHAQLQDSQIAPFGPEGRLISTIMTEKTERQIPPSRRSMWQDLRTANAVKLEFVEPGWTAGAVRRIRQAQQGDILIALGGGEGVEHLAQLYAAAGKPVIPLDLTIGGSTEDGFGGASHLAREARTYPHHFVNPHDPEAAADLIARTSTKDGHADIAEVVAAVTELVRALEPPSVFYVRLLNPSEPTYSAVERFFREIVDPTIIQLGYRAIEMGRGVNQYAWMNEAIFDHLHYSAVVVVDLTGLRNNCFMEYGYALGHGQRVILTAQQGTPLPFDTSAIDCHMWVDEADLVTRIKRFKEYWQRNINRPPLVKPRGLL